VSHVLVVDVEDKEGNEWSEMTPYDSGLSGWRLLWDRWCPIPALRTDTKMPRYNAIINQLVGALGRQPQAAGRG
jgi:hypothetical protein